jgi:hypothetical protein
LALLGKLQRLSWPWPRENRVRRSRSSSSGQISTRREVLEALELDRDALLESYARMTPAALDTLSPEERHQVYKMLRLTVEISPDGSLDVTGVLGDSFVSENQDERLGSDLQTLMTPELMFRALVTEDGAQRLELATT